MTGRNDEFQRNHARSISGFKWLRWQILSQLIFPDPPTMRRLSIREALQSYDPLEAYASALAKIGLKLQKTSVAITRLVIDHIDNLPTANHGAGKQLSPHFSHNDFHQSALWFDASTRCAAW